jgi:hypothetical protein
MNERRRDTDEIEALISLVRAVPAVVRVVRYSRNRQGSRVTGIELQLRRSRPLRWIVAVVPRALRPKSAGLVALELSTCVGEGLGDYAVVLAPYVSPRSAEFLAGGGIGFLDQSGNCHLISGPLLIERTGFRNEHVERVEQRSLFTPAAERVLRAVLDPTHRARRWSVRELAEAAWPGVSVGQAHKVAKRLESEAFLRRAEDGLVVVDPEKLLDAWVAGYRFGRSRAARWYSPLGPGELRKRIVALLTHGSKKRPAGALASFSAAEALAPFVRQHRFFVYWRGAMAPLVKTLELKAVPNGENVVVYTPYDEGVLYPGPASDEPVTCPLQTFLDLRASPGRGDEAAQAIFDKYLQKAYRR